MLKLRVTHSLHFYPTVTISVEFIEGTSEEISGISLRKRPNSDTKIVVLSFREPKFPIDLEGDRGVISRSVGSVWAK